ncbi:hypothetical protein PENTCL1PPCAC_8443 [Pristionchus entomophagus]|uniref:Uncharacterized protein n=1 Tax=Pristionchus entomophagus TaxID=358040 RepID=A0AAV5SSZ8_9BILA|nr:hypothetical protein PENTCL1PPCAC_8443 [Pristionchus entomophagus]
MAYFVFFVASLLVCGVAAAGRTYADFVQEMEEQLAMEQAALEELGGGAWPPHAGGSRSRGRREEDAPTRMCGTALLQHAMNVCSTCAGGRRKRDTAAASSASSSDAIFSSRQRRASDSKLISSMCCTNACRPSQIRALCCA